MESHEQVIAENRASRERLRALAARLSAAELGRSVSGGWTVADTLAHLAFWDYRALNLLEQFERGLFSLPDENPTDIDALNEAAHRLAAGLAPEQAARLAVQAADETDGHIEAGGPALAQRLQSAGNPVNLRRWEHRLEHVDEIVALLGA